MQGPSHYAALKNLIKWIDVHTAGLSLGDPNGVLSGYKLSAWAQLNDFVLTGFLQVSRRHKPGRVEANYPDHDLTNALGAAGALGLIAAVQLIAIAKRDDLLPAFMEKMSEYAAPTAA
jgi:hypothetical protein